ncbi:MAG TPA: thiamine pyrophosphate-binding protein [Ktedonobacterales bacterium]
MLRSLGMTTVFRNPVSTEETFLEHFPSDFTYVLALQEASVVAMADGKAQATGRPAFVNLHSAPGTANAMGNLVAAWHNKTPLVVTAGQQTRMMDLIEPWLTNLRAGIAPPVCEVEIRALTCPGCSRGLDAWLRHGRAAALRSTCHCRWTIGINLLTGARRCGR